MSLSFTDETVSTKPALPLVEKRENLFSNWKQAKTISGAIKLEQRNSCPKQRCSRRDRAEQQKSINFVLCEIKLKGTQFSCKETRTLVWVK